MTNDELVAALRANKLACEYAEGEWYVPTHDTPEPWALVTYCEAPSAETGEVGWCWWALGDMGAAPSYESARAAAERAVALRAEERER